MFPRSHRNLEEDLMDPTCTFYCEKCRELLVRNRPFIKERRYMSQSKNSDTSMNEFTASSEILSALDKLLTEEGLTGVSAIHVQVETAHGSVSIDWYAP